MMPSLLELWKMTLLRSLQIKPSTPDQKVLDLAKLKQMLRALKLTFSHLRYLPFCLSLSMIGATSGCGFVSFPGVYKIDIEQGNLVTQDMIEQLQPRMSRRQVRFIMGSPLVEDTFATDRWDYPYIIRNGKTVIREAQVSIYFDGDELDRIEGDYLPDWATSTDASAALNSSE
ncbi:MAG: outer membrane protein assembly factor BamE [Pseudomonadota bacterium]